jgi:hypothetical protein
MIIHHVISRASRLGLPSLSSLGSDRLAVGLAPLLDDSYHYLRHVSLGGARIDAVVVGPGGTWTVTTGHESGRFHKRNGHWYRWNRSTDSWVPWAAEEVMNARLAGHRLELHLDRAGLPAAVEPVLLIAPDVQLDWEPTERPGVHVHDDVARLGARVARDEVLTPAQVDRIVALLDPRQPLTRLAPSTPRG